MNLDDAPSGRPYAALPLDADQGFPQAFSYAFNGITYFFSLYVNIAADLLASQVAGLFALPTTNSFLVARVDIENPDSTRNTIFLRKLVPDVEYGTRDIALYFPEQTVARQNLNGQGNFGSVVIGGIAARWA